MHTKFEECSFIRYRDIEGVSKFQNWARTPGHAHLGGQFVVCWQEQPRIHVHTKFEESSFIRYRDIEGSQISFLPAPSLATEPIRHKINRLRGTVEEYYSSEFQVIPIKRFLSRAVTYIQTYKHTSKVKTVSTPMHYVLGVDNDTTFDKCLTAIFMDNPGKPVQNVSILDFIVAKDERGGGDNGTVRRA